MLRPREPSEIAMKITTVAVALACGLTLCIQHTAAQHGREHTMLDPAELVWNDFPSLPGVKIALIEGPLDRPVPIMFRLKFPAKFKVPSYWQSGIEHITVISGTLHLGVGSDTDLSQTRSLGLGSLAIMQPRIPHYMWSNEETIAQVHSTGPWSMHYVADGRDKDKED